MTPLDLLRSASFEQDRQRGLRERAHQLRQKADSLIDM